MSKYRKTTPLRCALRKKLLILFLSVTEISPAKAGRAYTILENMRAPNITDSACRERLIFGYICANKNSSEDEIPEHDVTYHLI